MPSLVDSSLNLSYTEAQLHYPEKRIETHPIRVPEENAIDAVLVQAQRIKEHLERFDTQLETGRRQLKELSGIDIHSNKKLHDHEKELWTKKNMAIHKLCLILPALKEHLLSPAADNHTLLQQCLSTCHKCISDICSWLYFFIPKT